MAGGQPGSIAQLLGQTHGIPIGFRRLRTQIGAQVIQFAQPHPAQEHLHRVARLLGEAECLLVGQQGIGGIVSPLQAHAVQQEGASPLAGRTVLFQVIDKGSRDGVGRNLLSLGSGQPLTHQTVYHPFMLTGIGSGLFEGVQSGEVGLPVR